MIIFWVQNYFLSTVRLKHPSDLEIYHIYISNSLQDRLVSCDTLTAVASDHSPVILNSGSINPHRPDSSYWKFNSQLVRNPAFCSKVELIEMVKIEYATLEPQIKWEIAKFKIREFSIAFSKKIAKDKRDTIANRKSHNALRNRTITKQTLQIRGRSSNCTRRR